MTIEIPVDGNREVALRVGMKVDFTTPLYKGEECLSSRIEVTNTLSVHPKEIFTFLKKNVGDIVHKGELIAQKKSFFNTHNVVSDSSGIITEIDHIDGVVLIESELDIHTETCWFTGEVSSVTKGHISLKIGKHLTAHTEHISDMFGGEVWFMKDDHEDVPLYPVACAPLINSYEQAKMDAMGVRGLITSASKSETFQFPVATLKDFTVLEQVKQKQLSYCVTQPQHSTIIFYSL